MFEGKGKWKGTFELMYSGNDSTWPLNISDLESLSLF